MSDFDKWWDAEMEENKHEFLFTMQDGCNWQALKDCCSIAWENGAYCERRKHEKKGDKHEQGNH